MKLNRRQSYIRTSEENLPVRKKKINWGKYIYILFLITCVSFGFYYVGKYYYYIEGTGQVIFNKLYIQHTRDIRLIDIFVKEGDKVKKGDPLFTYTDDRAENPQVAVIDKPDISVVNYSNDTEREKLRTIQTINIKQLEKKSIEIQLAVHEHDFDEIRKHVILETYLPDRLNELKEKIREARLLADKTTQEISILNDYLGRLRKLNTIKEAKTPSSPAGAIAPVPSNMTFVAQEDGVVTRIYISPFEVSLKGEIIMEIYKPEQIAIKAFFDQKDIEHLKSGQNVTIEFPDGSYGRGSIARYYFATVALPPEFQKRYEPVKRTIAADIVPATAEDAIQWKSFYKIGVRIFFSRFGG